MIKNIKHIIGANLQTLKYLSYERKLLLRHLGSFNTKDNKEKFKSYLMIQGHIIEKGLTFHEVKVGFGEEKVRELVKDLREYFLKYNDKEFCEMILGILSSYFEFNMKNNHLNQSIYDIFMELVDLVGPSPDKSQITGILHVTKDQILERSKIDFERFINSRYSIRDFSNDPIDINIVIHALRISWKTPSACNRQPWRAHLIVDKAKVIQMLDLQTGARQFKGNIACVILITTSYNCFFGPEYHQPYVNGGLFAMSLIYALHSMGLGTIPLNMGIDNFRLRQLKNIIEINEDEVPILLIGVGALPNELNVACSNRFNPDNYIKIY